MKFDSYTTLLKSAISVVVFLFGAFSGFQLKFAPPDPSKELQIHIGIAPFMALAILFFISLLCNFQVTQKKAYQRIFIRLWLWIDAILIIGFVVSGIVYAANMKNHTVLHKLTGYPADKEFGTDPGFQSNL
ncbi:MAG: hypothetical protein ABIS01_03205 [Ferruginibacter sp.]